jgi:hypothetical protein
LTKPATIGRGEPYDPETGELLLATDAVEVVVKATEARAGGVAGATENSIAEPAPSTAETRAGCPCIPIFELRSGIGLVVMIRHDLGGASALNPRLLSDQS